MDTSQFCKASFIKIVIRLVFPEDIEVISLQKNMQNYLTTNISFGNKKNKCAGNHMMVFSYILFKVPLETISEMMFVQL